MIFKGKFKKRVPFYLSIVKEKKTKTKRSNYSKHYGLSKHQKCSRVQI